MCCSNTNLNPSFSELICFDYFRRLFDVCYGPPYNGLPAWVTDLFPNLSHLEFEFDMSLITQSIIRRALSKCSNSSSPGPDNITYFHLKNLPCTHLFLATLFSRIFTSPFAPTTWCSGRILLFHKKGDNSVPENFRPIALTSTIGKLFHRILAKRLERYLIDNCFLDPCLQKGFLKGINGVMEHILSLNSILDNAKANNLPLFLTFIDLRNAFGSIHHALILDMLSLTHVPVPILSYISDLYSKLSAFVSTKQWSTAPFDISRGVFQGDTLSPLLFLLCFQPIVSLSNSLSTCGFQLKLPIANSAGLPAVDSYIYVIWNEPNSDELPGWYHCQILEYLTDGKAVLEYRDKSMKRIDLRKIKWEFARKNGKSFLPSNVSPLYILLRKSDNFLLSPSLPYRNLRR